MDYLYSVATIAGINVIMSLSFYLPFMTGQISLGQAGFMAIGAYASAVCTVKFGMPFPLAIIIGGLAAGFIGFLLGLPALRIKGIYLLLLTLGFGEIVKEILLNLEYTGGASGFTGIPYQEYMNCYVYGTIVVLVICFHRLRYSSLGRAVQGVGLDESAAEAFGVNITFTKLQVFTVGAVIAGIGGGYFAHFQEYLDPLMFGVMHAVEFIVFTIFGGVQIFWGPVFGAMFLSFLPEVLRDIQEWRMEIYGVLLVIMMIVRPRGLIGLDTLAWLGRLFSRRRASEETELSGDESMGPEEAALEPGERR